MVDPPERLEEFVFSSDFTQGVETQLRKTLFESVDALRHLLETREPIASRIRAPQQMRKPMQG